MKIESIRIRYFRSIVDSDWLDLSPDGVTVFIGQNESGKSSVLEALAAASGSRNISEDDYRTDVHPQSPEVFLAFRLDSHDELNSWFEEEEFGSQIHHDLVDCFTRSDNRIILKSSWVKDEVGTYKRVCSIEDPLFATLFEARTSSSAMLSIKTAQNGAADEIELTSEKATKDGEKSEKVVSLAVIASAVNDYRPSVVFVEQNINVLPNTVDVVINKWGRYELTGNGAATANNFLRVAGLKLEELVNANERQRESLLKKANATISKDFALFWAQRIGHTDNLQLQCDMAYYGEMSGEKIGKPYLRFWISDGITRLYPRQRSLGVRWFLSFYLRIRASEKTGVRSLYLLDEPGANLHPKAQLDVLKLINELSKELPIAYSTHSAHMIEYEKLYRVIAVQREGDEDDSPTTFVDAHRLGSASHDTLSPILSAMGIDLSHQRVIKAKNNVLLEEVSGFYYLKAFWKLTQAEQEAYFIAASGVDNVPKFANMFRGWGLDFIIAIDDDSQGRTVYGKLLRYFYGDDEKLASLNMFKFPDCKGIEDVFSRQDFKNLVLKDATLDGAKANSDVMKSGARSKPITAYKFLLDVESGVLKWEHLDEESQKRIGAVVAGIVNRLKEKATL
jgi:predicted ATPase